MNKRPIYVNECELTNDAMAVLEEAVDRPIVYVCKNPKEVIYDSQEELRDKFAMAALTGMVQTVMCGTNEEIKKVIKFSYKYADEMLKQRGNDV